LEIIWIVAWLDLNSEENVLNRGFGVYSKELICWECMGKGINIPEESKEVNGFV
jgi:hypothetical protein